MSRSAFRRARCSAVTLVLLLGLIGSWTSVAAAEDASPAAEPAPASWRQVSSGASHSCGIRTTGRLYCWGYDGWGQLGDGGPNADMSTPVEVFGGGTNWAAVAAGGAHTCALKTNGHLWCWGSDQFGEVGDGGSNVDQAIPVEVLGGASDWSAVSTGGNVTCAVKTTGRLYCWGRDDTGQVGDGGGITSQPAPVLVAGAATNWTAVRVGSLDVCATRATGRLYCWGDDSRGQLGNGGPNQGHRAPVRVALFSDFTQVAVGDFYACGIRSNGFLYCWGGDVEGELGNGGGAVERHVPVRVAGGPITWSAVSAGSYDACATRPNGRLYCWGTDDDGVLGNGGTNVNRQAPTQVAGGITNWAQPANGYRHNCALRSSGRVYCWGADFAGQLGDGGANTGRSTPGRVL